MKPTIILAAMLLAASSAWADAVPLNKRTFSEAGAQTGTLCSAEDTTGACASTDEIVLDLRGKWSIAFYGNQSSATTYTCNVFSNDVGYDASSGEGQQMNASALTQSNQYLALEGLMGYVWINCTTITGGTVTVTYIAVPLAK